METKVDIEIVCKVKRSGRFTSEYSSFAKPNDQVDSLVNRVYTFSEDIGMEFGIKRCGVLVLKQGKFDKVISKGLNLPNGKLMKTIDEEGYKHLGMLEYDKVKEKEMKTEFLRGYKRRLRLIFRSKLNEKNKIKAIKSWAVAIVRYDAGETHSSVLACGHVFRTVHYKHVFSYIFCQKT